MTNTIRWLYVPVAPLGGWCVAILTGILLLNLADSFCPPAEFISGICTAQWYRFIEKLVLCFSGALGAAVVVFSAFAAAPSHKVIASWASSAVGAVIALYFAFAGRFWFEFLATVISGLVTALVLYRKSVASNPALQSNRAKTRGRLS